MTLSINFNQPEYPITTNDQLYAVRYKVYESSPIQSSHIYATSEEDAVSKYEEWLGSHYSISAAALNYSVWNLQETGEDWSMICTGTKHNNQPLYKYYPR